MINQVYTTVLSILNKESRGYITPTEFNMYAELAQMGLFEDLFHKYSKSIVKQNNRLYNSEYSDIPKHIREVIDIFTKIERNVLIDRGLYYVNDSTFYRLINLDYVGVDVEEVSKLEINKMLNNDLIAPSLSYPVYINIMGNYKIYPIGISPTSFNATYIRKPIQPKWTYSVVAGNPLFNPTAGDYQDFELPTSMFNEIVIKILSYCGIQIREADVVQATQIMEGLNVNNEQL
jgi:hypothetical protein